MSTRQPTHVTTDPPTYLVLTTALSSDMGAVAKLVKELLREADEDEAPSEGRRGARKSVGVDKGPLWKSKMEGEGLEGDGASRDGVGAHGGGPPDTCDEKARDRPSGGTSGGGGASAEAVEAAARAGVADEWATATAEAFQRGVLGALENVRTLAPAMKVMRQAAIEQSVP